MSAPVPLKRSPSTPRPTTRETWFWTGLIVLTVALFYGPLRDWFKFALEDDLYSHAVIVPLISSYLIWWARLWPLQRQAVPPAIRSVAGGGFLIGMLLGHGIIPPIIGSSDSSIDSFSSSMLGFVLCIGAASLGVLGWRGLKAVLAPWLVLLFMVPFPESVLLGIETFLQYGSAAVAGWLFQVADTPVLISGLVMKLPGVSIQVARECSGIHSTVVLFITATTAGLVFLKTGWARTLLIGLAIPLALVRNGFRVFTLGELAVKLGPEVLDSWIHHDGGPYFFAASLIPLGLLLLLLRKWEVRRSGREQELVKPAPTTP